MKQETYDKLTDMLNEAISKETQESWNAYLDSCQTKTDKAADDYVGHPKEVDEGITVSSRREAFKDGAKWYKEQLLKTAIDGLVIRDEELTNGYKDIVLEIPDYLEEGDKVKMIIVKVDEP